MRHLLWLKQRDISKGLILIAADITQLEPFLTDISREQRAKLQISWPGAVTWLVPDNGLVPPWIRGEHDAVALRVTAHPLASQLCRAFGGPIVSTSANLAGQPAARHAWQLHRQFNAGLDFILPGSLGGNARPSVIRDLRSDAIVRA